MQDLWGFFRVNFPYYSHVRIPKDMGIVWEAGRSQVFFWNHRPPRSLDLTAYIFSFLDVCTKITSALSISMGLREVPGFGRRKHPHKQRGICEFGWEM